MSKAFLVLILATMIMVENVSGLCSSTLAAGRQHTCAIRSGGTFCWGYNRYGQLGIGNTVSALTPTLVDLGTGLTATCIALGTYHTCALRSDGKVVCWGFNSNGELGIGNNSHVGGGPNQMGSNLVAVDLGPGATVTSLVVGGSHTCVLRSDGSVVCWGNNDYGQLGIGNTTRVGVSPGQMGSNLRAVDLGTGQSATALTAGGSHTCALRSDGSMVCWGYNLFGQLGIGSRTNVGDKPNQMGNNLIAVDLGAALSATALFAGESNTCALRTDNTLVCWGDGSMGQLGIGSTWSVGFQANEMGNNLTAVDLGGLRATVLAPSPRHNCALRSDGSVVCWGNNGFGQLGIGTRLPVGSDPYQMGSNLTRVDLGTGITAINVISGGFHSCAQRTDNKVVCWGHNTDGQLGVGHTLDIGDNPNEMGNSLIAVNFGIEIGPTVPTSSLATSTSLMTSTLLRTSTPSRTSTSLENSTLTQLPYSTSPATVCNPGSYLAWRQTTVVVDNMNHTASSLACEPCAAGTCSNISGATSCSTCDPKDIFCGGSFCESPSLYTEFSGATVLVTMIVPIPYQQFTQTMLLNYIYALAMTLNRTVGPDWIRVVSVAEEGTVRRRLLISATHMEMQLKINSQDCETIKFLTTEKISPETQKIGLEPPTKVATSTSGCWELSVLSKELKAQATATTAVVAGVLGAILGVSVAGSVAGAVGSYFSAGTSGSSVASSGASVYQLITATQFLNIFGNVIDKREIPKTEFVGSRRAVESNITTTIITSGSTSAATTFSSSFGWANMRFDDIFRLRENSCGARFLQPFFGIFGTFIASLVGSFGLRAVINYATKRVMQSMNGEFPLRSMPGFRPGQYEFHVIKTAHLGLCQAAGSVLSVAVNRGPGCPCGWLIQAMWALAICWLICLPIGFILFSAMRMVLALRSKRIMFHTLKGGGSWRFYLTKILAAHGTAEDFCRPTVIHTIIRTVLGAGGCVCVFMGLRAATARVLVDSVVLFVVGTALGFLSLHVSSTLGRKIVVVITNYFAAVVGKKYMLNQDGAVREEGRSPSFTRLGKMMLDQLGSCKCMLDVAGDRGNLRLLRDRGRWLRKDNMRMFYSDYHEGGILFSVFWMIKNLLIGILLTEEPVLVQPIVKAWVIMIIYLFEFIILAFFSPDVDAFNGVKMAFQSLQQLVIIFIGALTVSNVLSFDTGANVCIHLSIIQVAFAIPEQMWALLKNTVLRKRGPQKEPEFKMTVKELEIQKQLDETGFAVRYDAAREAIMKLKALVPAMKKGDIKGLVVRIIADEELLLKLNMVKPGCLIPLFHEVFCCEAIHEGLQEVADGLPLVAKPFKSLAANPWETSVDFKDGVQDIFDIKELIETVVRTGDALGKLELVQAACELLGCEPLLECLAEQKDESTISVIQSMKGLFQSRYLQEAIKVAKNKVKDPTLHENLEKLLHIEEVEDEDVLGLITAVRGMRNCQHLDGSKTAFSLSKDILSHLEMQDAITFLQLLGDAIPEPAHALFTEALEVAAVAPALKKLVDKIRDFDLLGAIEAFLCSRELVLSLEHLAPGAIYPALRNTFQLPAMTTAVTMFKHSAPQLEKHLDALLALRYETPNDLEVFVESMEAIIGTSLDYDEQHSFSFVRDVLHRLNDKDVVTVIRCLEDTMPEPARTVLTQATEVLDVVLIAKRLIDRIRALDLSGAMEVVLCTPDFTQGMEKLLQGSVYPVLNAVIQCQPFQRAIHDAMMAVPELEHKLSYLAGLQFSTVADLEGFNSTVTDLREWTLSHDVNSSFSFTRDVVGRIDEQTAIDLLKRLSDNMQGAAAEMFRKATEALDLVPTAKRMADLVRIRRYGETAEALLTSPEFLRCLDRLAPGVVYPALRALLRSPPMVAAASATRSKAPELSGLLEQVQEARLETAEDLEDFVRTVQKLTTWTPADSSSNGVRFGAEIAAHVDEEAVRGLFSQLGRRLPAPARRVLQAIMPIDNASGDHDKGEDTMAKSRNIASGGANKVHAAGSKTTSARTGPSLIGPSSDGMVSGSIVYIAANGKTNDHEGKDTPAPFPKEAWAADTSAAHATSFKHNGANPHGVQPNKGKLPLDFVGLLVKVVSRMDPEQAVVVIQRLEDAIPEPAQVLTEDGFDALYEVASAACEMREALAAPDGEPDAGGERDAEAQRPSSAARRPAKGAGLETEEEMGGDLGLVETIRREPEWLLFIVMCMLGVATVVLLGVIANADGDCGCTCPA